MTATTKAIVLSSLKYSDNSLIVKCLTRDFGTKSYLIQGVLSSSKKSMKPAHFIPFTLLEIVANHKNQGTLERIREARIAQPCHSIHTDIYKSSVAMFLSEICSNVCDVGHDDEALYNFIETALLQLDKNEFSANFHIKFLIELTRFLGIYPDIPDDESFYFNIEEGKTVTFGNTEQNISGNSLVFLRKILTTDFDELQQLKINREERNQLLIKILEYYEWHNTGYRKSQSLEILQTLFV